MRILRTVTSLVAAFAITFTVGATTAPATSDTWIVEAHSAFSVSDDDLLKGLIYGQGPVAEGLGLQVTLPSRLADTQYTESVEYSIQELKVNYPDKIQEALMMLREDDPVVVENGLDMLSSIALEYEEYKLPRQNRTNVSDSPSACGVALVCVAYAAAAVHNTVVVTGLAAVVVGGAVVAGTWLWVGKGESSPSTVREEIVADLISIT